uniref:S-methyl-5-thioribose-1-phosphate isomerase n=1 Tax=Arcella intermedia TaxID=1963864 RepID=A0A6B2L9K4_9EUKA
MVLDQRKLPNEEIWLSCDSVEEMWVYIHELATRGAPLIGCSAALALAFYAIHHSPSKSQLIAKAEYLKTSRPTAVNLMYACDLISQYSNPMADFSVGSVVDIAFNILQREINMSQNMATHGDSLIQPQENILTHCNTGSLATLGLGTALGVIKLSHSKKKNIHVYVDETRPLLQGARLTTWELKRAGIPYTLICDNMAATLMRAGKINRVFVGADRIALNGDFANKIGTYSVAVLAKYHNVPFHVVAPVSTVDFNCATGGDIPIEERKSEEVEGALGHRWATKGSPVFNPSFDITPASLVTSWVLDTALYNQKQVIHQQIFKSLAPTTSKL